MTALKDYARLEATGLWRASRDEQRREVVVSVGEATLTISDLQDRALTHWSLAAVERRNPGETPVIYGPDGDPGETLELDASERAMIDAIEKLRIAVESTRPHPGRLRWLGVGLSVLAVLGVLTLWLPGAVIRHTASVVPEIKRAEIGAAVLNRIERVAGRACGDAQTDVILAQLARRTGGGRIVVLPAGLRDSRHLPGGIVLLHRSLVEDQQDPAIAAGFVLSERVRATGADPLVVMLRTTGAVTAFRLLTTGDVSDPAIDTYAEAVLAAPRDPVPAGDLLAAFGAAQVPTTPYAYARDPSGETTLALIEADPMAGASPPPVLPDRDWVRVQNVCGG